MLVRPGSVYSLPSYEFTLSANSEKSSQSKSGWYRFGSSKNWFSSSSQPGFTYSMNQKSGTSCTSQGWLPAPQVTSRLRCDSRVPITSISTLMPVISSNGAIISRIQVSPKPGWRMNLTVVPWYGSAALASVHGPSIGAASPDDASCSAAANASAGHNSAGNSSSAAGSNLCEIVRFITNSF